MADKARFRHSTRNKRLFDFFFLKPLFACMFSALATQLSFGEISFLTLQAVVQVTLIALAGFWAAQNGLLPATGVKVVSRLNVDLFTPALIFSKLASSLSIAKLLEVIIIPLLFALTTGVSYVASLLVAKWLSLNEPESNFVTAMSVFGNSNSLPVSLTLALAYSLPDLEWDDIPDDTPDKIASRGLIYLLIFQQLGQMLRWSWGYNKLLRPQPHHVLFHLDATDLEQLPVMSSTLEDMTDRDNSHMHGDMDDDEDDLPLLGSNREPSPDTSEEEPATKPDEVKPFYIRIVQTFISVMNPPLWSMLLAMIVASVPFLKYQFYEADGFIQHTLSSSIRQLGSVSIPLILVVLGANLAPSSDIPPASPHCNRMIFGALLGRMVLPSMVLLPTVVVCVKYLNISIMDDPIFLITSFLLITSPPAIQLSQICQLNEIYQKEMAGVLFYGYAILTLPVTIIVVATCLEAMKWAQVT